jgi:hypothetical protein
LSAGLAVSIALASTTLLTAGAALTASPAAADDTCTTPSLQNFALSSDPFDSPTYTVPAGVHRVVLTVGGQAGQDWSLNGSSFSGGRGTNVQVVMDVTPGQKLQNGILIGAPGGGSPPGPDTGENLDAIGPDGGRGGTAGFWAVVGPTISGDQDPFNDGPRVCLIPIVMAAGGGGAGGDPGIANAPVGASAGGDADTGAGAGAGGNGGHNNAVDGAGGQGATAAGGGAGGAFGYGDICPDGFSGTSGGLLSGGDGGKGHEYNNLGGATSCHAGTGAGGGGAGYYYGGGGGSGEGTHASGGGGGGSPYIDPSVLTVSETATALGAAMDPDNPTLAPVYDTSTTLNSSLNPSVQGDDVTLTADVSTVNPDFQVGGGTVTFRDFSNSGATLGSAPVVLNSDGTATASYTTSTLPPGTHSIGAFYDGYAAATYTDRSSGSPHVSQSVTPTQTINFTSTAPAGATAYGPTYTVSATATSALPVTFSLDPAAAAVCSVTGTTVSFVGAGTCVVDADQDGSPGYAPAPTVHQDITVAAGASQTITFTSTPPDIVHVNDSYVVTATGGGSRKPVVFSIPPGNACSIQGTSTVKCSVGGTWTIDADQAGGNSYAPAPTAHQHITIQPGPQSVTFDTTPPAAPQIGDTYLVKAHASSSAQVALTLDAASVGCTLSTPAISEGPGYFITSATVTFTGHGTCVVDGNQPGFASFEAAPQVQQTMTVAKAPQAITFSSSPPASPKVGGGAYTVSADGGASGKPVTFSIDASSTAGACSIAGAVISFTGVGTCQVDADQAGDATYDAAPQVQQTMTVGKGTPTISWSDPADIVYGTALGSTQLNATASVPGSFNYTPASGAVLGAGLHPLTATFTPTDTTDYTTAPAMVYVTVTPATLTVTPADKPKTYGDTDPAFGFAITGYKNGDPTTVVTTQPTCGVVAAHVNVGTYTIACSGGDAGANYTFDDTKTASLTVGPATLTVTPADQSKAYGGSEPTFGFAITGYKNGDPTTVVTTQPTCGVAGAHVNVGKYTIACSGGDAGDNYTFDDTKTATLSVTPVALTANVAGTRVYGSASQSFNVASYTGLVNGDSSPGASGTLKFCTSSVAPSASVGSYAHTISLCSGLSAANYAPISYADAGFSVTPAPLKVTASSPPMTYGDPVPAITPSYVGFVNGDNAATLATAPNAAPTCSTTVTSSSAPGTYSGADSCIGAVDANYTITYAVGSLTVNKRPASLSYTGPLMIGTAPSTATSTTVTVQALVTQSGSGGDLTKAAPLEFLFYKSSNLTMTTPDASCTATSVSSAGVASCQIISLGVDNWTVAVREPANSFFTAPDSDPVVLTVYQPLAGASTNGGGWINDPSTNNMPVGVSTANRHGNFGFSVRYKNGTTTPQGQAVYVFRGANGYDYVIKSNSWQGGGFTIANGNQASFSGKANVTVIDPKTGLAIAGLGGGNFSYRADATDKGTGGSTDTYAVTIYDGSGKLYHQVGTTPSQLTLGGGNITTRVS